MDTKCTVLVDGATGFVGSRLVKELIAAGFMVRATDLPGSDMSYAKDLGAEVVYSDLLKPETLDVAAEGVDYVVHCAALFSLTADIEALRRVNVMGTENLLKSLVGKNVKHFVHISSCDIYGDLKYLPGDENHPQNPINHYAISKKESEEVVWKYAKGHGVPTTVMRPSAIYGPGSVYIAGVFFFWPIFVRFLGLSRYFYISRGCKLTFAHIDDIVGSVRFILGREDAFGEAFNIADEEYIGSCVFASELLKAFGVKNLLPFTIPLPAFVVNTYARLMLLISGPLLRVLNSWVKGRWSKLQKKFGLSTQFAPHFERQFYNYFIGHRYFTSSKIENLGYKFKNRSFYEGFPGTFQWYLDNKWLPPIGELGKMIR